MLQSPLFFFIPTTWKRINYRLKSDHLDKQLGMARSTPSSRALGSDKHSLKVSTQTTVHAPTSSMLAHLNYNTALRLAYAHGFMWLAGHVSFFVCPATFPTIRNFLWMKYSSPFSFSLDKSVNLDPCSQTFYAKDVPGGSFSQSSKTYNHCLELC